MYRCFQYTIIAVAFFCAGQTFAQLKVLPIKSENASPSPKETPYARTTEHGPLPLPFWDDFSFTDHRPAVERWQNSGNVIVNDGLALNPPSLGVASLDGLDASGNGLGHGQSESGKTDSLTSHPIDLSSYTEASNVYLSFFYQHAGTGEGPDSSDSLRLEFKNIDGAWVSIWPGSAALDRTGTFSQVLVKISDPSFFHANFQFRFQSFGLQSGPYDVWNVDYVYLNKGRNETDTSFPDRTINAPLTSFLREFTAVPYAHFSINDTIHPTFGIANLNTAGQPRQPFDYFINTKTTFIQQGDTLPPVIDSYTVPDPVESPIAHGLENSKTAKLPNVFSDISGRQADTAIVDIKIFLNSGDNEAPDYDPAIYAPIDFRNNDTTRTSFMLSNYYAYDDGTAEYAAALNASGTSLAYKFNMNRDTTDHIVAIDIYFPYIGTDPAGRAIDLTVWETIAEDTASATKVKHREDIIIKRNGLNQVVRYPLSTAIAVQDSFYIGYKQRTSGYLGVGLDKNTNSAGKIFYNLDGSWQKNQNIDGSLMMRPVFGEPGDELATGIDPVETLPAIKVYPNPSSGSFRISGDFQRLKVFDIRGVEKSFELSFEGNDAILQLNEHPSGFYMLQFVKDSSLHTIKVLKR